MIRVLNLLVLITPLPQRISCIVSNHPGISIPVIQSSTRSTHTQGHYKRESQASQRLLRLWYWILVSTMCTLCSPNVPEMHVDDHPFCCQAKCVRTFNVFISDAIFSEKRPIPLHLKWSWLRTRLFYETVPSYDWTKTKDTAKGKMIQNKKIVTEPNM